MRWVSSLSLNPDFPSAITECLDTIRDAFPDGPPSLVFAFISPHHLHHYRDLPHRIRSEFPTTSLVGCSGGGIIGDQEEIEQRAALSLIAADLPDVAVHLVRLPAEPLPPPEDKDSWFDAIGVDPDLQPHFVILPDPFGFDSEALLRGLDHNYPHSVKIGGVASGARSPGDNALFLDDEVYDMGMVGVALYGDVDVDTIVAQGCRPIGKPLSVTSAKGNLVFELDESPALDVLQRLLADLAPRERALFQQGPHLGVVMDADLHKPRHGDFLIRNVFGIQRSTNAIAVGHLLEPGNVVQFHVRDAQTSSDDLNELLSRYQRGPRLESPTGALLFSCLGRGEYLYGTPNHDVKAFHNRLGSVPIGGFFCNGEIGPVHGRTYLHGYTSSIGLFKPRGWN